jgi:hypothetical protein
MTSDPQAPAAPPAVDQRSEAGVDGPAQVTPPTPAVDIGGWPTWQRRTAIGLALAVAVAVLVWGAARSGPSAENEGLDPVIVQVFPVPDAQALRQTEVGVDLRDGYDGRLTINGVEIPEAQMEGAVDPREVKPEDLRKYGVRPNNRNRVYFKPGPGKVIESFTSGKVTITVRYFRDRHETQGGGSFTWTIRVD